MTAFQRVLQPWLLERTILDDDELLVVDKPSGVVVHGGDERLAADLVGRLRRWFETSGRPSYLGIHQRLDKDASGVLVFTRAERLNRELSRAFENHELERTYWAAVSGRLLPSQGCLENRLAASEGKTQVVSSGGQIARAYYRVMERRSHRQLVMLKPQTGRTHQLRAQLAAAGAPIAGDRLYGGEQANRLLLHASELRVIGHHFAAPTPQEFRLWMDGTDLGLGTPDRVAGVIRDAAWLRQPLHYENTAYRLVNEQADGLPGVTVDRYGDFAVLTVSSDEAYARRFELGEALLAIGARGIFLKARLGGDPRKLDSSLTPPAPLLGTSPSGALEVREGPLRWLVLLGDGAHTGLFLDQRDNRARLWRAARGLRVLNLFAYTCSFSVAAAAGGAREVVSVDLSNRALQRGRANMELNGVAPDAHPFIRADVVDWLGRAQKRQERFDWIVLDPPTFGTRREGRHFTVEQAYSGVARDALTLLGSGGRLLAVTNHRATSLLRLRQVLHRAARAAGRQVIQMKDLASGFDHPPTFAGPQPSKSVLVTVA